MTVALKNLYAFPSFIPIPELYCHVVRCGEDEGLRWMYNNGTDVVWVGFEGGDFLGSVIVVDSELEVI